jgi:hypothetical protein
VSTYWDVRCLDCDVESGLHLNHGDDTCRDLIKFRDAFAAFAVAAENAPSMVEISISVPGEIGHVDPSFYRTHVGHVLAAVNEYGHIDGDCNEWSKDPTVMGNCCALAKHGGDHDFHDVAPWESGWKEILKRAAERRRCS